MVLDCRSPTGMPNIQQIQVGRLISSTRCWVYLQGNSAGGLENLGYHPGPSPTSYYTFLTLTPQDDDENFPCLKIPVCALSAPDTRRHFLQSRNWPLQYIYIYQTSVRSAGSTLHELCIKFSLLEQEENTQSESLMV
jgi:hypothetical protein